MWDFMIERNMGKIMKYSPYRAYKPPRENKRSSPNGKKPMRALVVLLFLLMIIVLISLSIIVLTPLYSEWQENKEPPVQPFIGDSTVGGLFVDPFSLYNMVEESEQQQLITAQLVEFCNTNSINTIFLYTKSNEIVAYDDKNFEPAFEEFDPLASISNAAAQNGIATVAILDLFGASLMKFDAEIVNGRYSASDEGYIEILTESLTRLFKRYPISGVAISNIDNDLTADVDTLFTGLTEQLSGRSVGVIFDELFPVDFADFAIVDTAFMVQASEELQGVDLYSIVGDLSLSEFDYFLYNHVQIAGNSGTIFGTYGEVDTASIARLAATSTPLAADPLPNYQLSTELSLTNPSSGYLRQTSGSCYIMGLSDPAQPLYMDGVEVTRLSSSGSFGILVSLDMGVNTFTFTQGEITAVAEIERYTYTGDGSSTPHDGTAQAAIGSYVEVSVPIASALFDVSSDANISETLRQGAIFTVTDNVLTTRSGKTTYAYRLSSGDWVMAYNTTVAAEDSGVCSGLTVTAHERGETIGFTGLGSPAVYDERLGNRLILTIYDVDFSAALASLEALKASSAHIDDASITTEENKTIITLDFSSQIPVWGHYVEYNNDSLAIDLIAAPSQPTGLPLEGFVIMLDAGHGDQDSGAPGIAGGISGPTEKELNLNLAKVLEARLIQLGAEVIMTRTDDSFPTLQERLIMSVTEKPHFFLSIHHNSIALTSDGNTAAGVEGYYFEEISRVFAESVNENVAGYTGRVSRGAFDGYFYVTRSTGSMSVLYEYGFVINPVEYDDLYSHEGVYSAVYGTAEGFVRAVEEFYRTHTTTN